MKTEYLPAFYREQYPEMVGEARSGKGAASESGGYG
jgi:hypothetical protein